MDRQAKVRALRRLGAARKSARCSGYRCLGEFYNGMFECAFVSPWSKASNVHAKVMIVGQDWASADMLNRKPPDREMAKRGYKPTLATNRHLDRLLKEHFGLVRGDCYLTNLFPFIKRGGASAGIKMKDLVRSGQDFTRQEIRIVAPKLVICLGLRTFRALMRVAGQPASPKMAQAIASSSFVLENAVVRCVAHTGALGMNNRSPKQVNADWRRLARSYPELCRR